MALITPGYWQSTYWPDSYWPQDYWGEYGAIVVTCRQKIIDAIDAKFKQIGGDMGTSIRQLIINAIDARFKGIN